MTDLTTAIAAQYVRGLEQNFEDAGDWGVQPTLILICTYTNQHTVGPDLLVPVPVVPSAWINDGELPADALDRIDPAALCTAGQPVLTPVAVALAHEVVVLSGKDARLLYCGLADGTLVGAGRVRGDAPNVKVYPPDHEHDVTPAAVRRLAMVVLGGS
ncbi:hypothetical protein FXF51_01775 [Nonomuraea sp. PA05]|uniref:hypothetical protein n=1 Tax=Nonomuraea sp. PA05 TaxID=2604466 RepID=UPI0011D6DB21|nr:hypothetical protein [Nonomuraea sp. PA05]TYB71191.1 hypothetical protein FXF51_01775 [Nonomuraea sp. PA05]